jgi:hypothetical protein
MLTLPEKGFTDTERAWLEALLAEIRSLRAVQGANVTVTSNEDGQVIAAHKCDCNLCP